MFASEETNISLDSSDGELVHLKDCTSQLRELFSKIATKKGNDTQIHEPNLSKLFLKIKELNRNAQLRLKKSRENTLEKKLQLDQKHLELQNLLYEVIQIEKEIQKCLEFKSSDEDIELVSVEEFYKNAPNDIARPEISRSDHHQEMLSRLSWELHQRQQLDLKKKSAKSTGEELHKNIRSKQEKLLSLRSKVKDIIQATRPVQDFLDLKFSEEEDQKLLSLQLPNAMFVLFNQIRSYAETLDSTIRVSIEGDIELARCTNQSNSEGFPSLNFGDESEVEDENDSKKKKKHRRKSRIHKVEDYLDRVLKLHPLVVMVDIHSDFACSLRLQFAYVSMLKLVTVKPCVTWSGEPPSSLVSDVFSTDVLLNYLFPGDHGDILQLLQQRHDLSKLTCLAKQTNLTNRMGCPYAWAQRLAGFNCLENMAERPNLQLAFSSVESVLKKIKKRFENRVELADQITAIDNNRLALSSEQSSKLHTKIDVNIESFRRSCYADFKINDNVQHLLEEGLVHECDLFYTFNTTRGLHQAKVMLVVPVDYPERLPLFVVTVEGETQTGLPKTNQNDLQIKILEEETNCYCNEFSSNKESGKNILVCQIVRLVASFDLYCQYEMGAVQQGQLRLLRPHKYPSRSCPLNYVPSLDTYIHR